jgi:hypothetical protein
MSKKNRIAGLITRALALTVIALILSTGLAGAFSNPLSVPFKAQVLPGTWSATKNCGQTSSLMVYSFYDGTTPTVQGIKDIDDWLFKKYGSSQAINSYSGSDTSTTILETLAKEYGGKYGVFSNTYKTSGWTVARVKQEIDAGHPVIVAVTGAFLGQSYGGHFLVAKGYTSTGIITNDPGRTSGVLTYTNTQFANAMTSQGGAVVVVMPNPITVTSPNGGEIWQIGYRTITWSYTGSPGSTVKIELVKSTGVATTIANWAPIGSGGKGSYSFFMTQPAGSYKVKITATSGSDTSKGYFTIR